MGNTAVIEEVEKPVKLEGLKDIASTIRAEIRSKRRNEIPEYSARTYIRVLKNLNKDFKDLYPVETVSDIIGISRANFGKWKAQKNTFQSVSFVGSWVNIKLLAKIHISLALLYQNKESIVNALIAKNDIFDESFYEIILSRDIEKMIALRNYLESIQS